MKHTQYVSVGKCILVPGKNNLPELIEFSGIPPSNLLVVEKGESSTYKSLSVNSETCQGFLQGQDLGKKLEVKRG